MKFEMPFGTSEFSTHIHYDTQSVLGIGGWGGEKIKHHVSEALVAALDTTRRSAVAEMKRYVPVGRFSKNPGTLRDSIRSTLSRSSELEATLKFVAGAENDGFQYGEMIEFGRPPISVKSKPYLKFRHTHTGKWITNLKEVGPARKQAFFYEPIEFYVQHKTKDYFNFAWDRISSNQPNRRVVRITGKGVK
jgi:hypothetical protein